MRKIGMILICAVIVFLFIGVVVSFAQEGVVAENPLEKLLDEYIRKKNVNKIKDLRTLVEQNVASEPTNPHAYFINGKLEFSLGQFDKAVSIFKSGLALDPQNATIQKALCQACLYANQGAEFTEAYYRWLKIEKDQKSLDQEYELAELAMSEGEVRKFRAVPLDEKPDFLIRYWREKDPYPISLENERLIEHMKRIRYARTAFHTNQGGFDDRGKVFIRWGQPEDKYVSSMPEQLSYQNESWYYPSYGLYMAFDFVDQTGYFREVNSLADAVLAGSPGNAQALYAERSELGGIYAMLARTDAQEFRNRVLTELPGEKISAKQNNNPRFEVKLNIAKLEFIDRISQFRGDSGKTRIELAYGLPLKQLKPSLKGDSITFVFQTDFVVLDSVSQRKMYSKNNFSFSLPAKTKYSDENVLHEEKNAIQPGDYKMCFQILEKSNDKGDFRTEPMHVRSYTGKDLMISDLKFSEKVESAGLDSLSGMERLSVLPYPFSFVTKKHTTYLYFEVYNLFLSPDNTSKYNISISVARKEKKGDFILQPWKSLGRIFSGGTPKTIESTYSREGKSRSSNEWIELDLSQLNTGDSRLAVTVNDSLASKEASSSIDFNIKGD